MASKIGRVPEAKLEAKGNSPLKVGRAKIYMDLLGPLKHGIIVRHGRKKLWIDFKYERLPDFCCSRGRIGHYATDCKEVPFEKSGLNENIERMFG